MYEYLLFIDMLMLGLGVEFVTTPLPGVFYREEFGLFNRLLECASQRHNALIVGDPKLATHSSIDTRGMLAKTLWFAQRQLAQLRLVFFGAKQTRSDPECVRIFSKKCHSAAMEL